MAIKPCFLKFHVKKLIVGQKNIDNDQKIVYSLMTKVMLINNL